MYSFDTVFLVIIANGLIIIKMRFLDSQTRFFILCAFLSMVLTGCLVGPDFHSPKPPMVESYTAHPIPITTTDIPLMGSAGKAQYFAAGRDIPAEWWYLFQSPELNALIDSGLAHSPNLVAAIAALREAEENLNAQVGTSLFPAVNGVLSHERQRQPGSIFGGQNIPAATFSLYTPELNVSYTLDVFGKARRQIEALCAQVDYQRFQLEAAYLTITSNIVVTAINIASLQAQIKATHELIQMQQETLDIVEQQFNLGGASQGDVLIQQTQLEQIRATLPPLLQNLARNQHALSALIGEFPSENDLPKFDLNKFSLPNELPISLPSLLVRQRPDIRAAEALMHAASAQVGVATANLFPQIDLTGSYGWEAPSISTLFDHTFSAWDILAKLTQPIFNGGALHAKRRAAIAAYKQAAEQYQQAVLQGFQNVADSLRALENDARTLQAQRLAEISAQHSMVLIEGQFHLGGVSFLSLLTAERQYQQAYINRIEAEAARFTDTAALFQALGGGWWNREALPLAAENINLPGTVPKCCAKHLTGLALDWDEALGLKKFGGVPYT
jgi:NodT family efflux transporter outer membrane factor (OMF) lipoprotein